MIWKAIRVIVVSTLLTIITQVGGLIYLFSLGLHPFINKTTSSRLTRGLLKFCCFVVLYIFCTLLLIPPLAKLNGRVPLPIFYEQNVKPVSILYPFLNRHYVRPPLKAAVLTAADEMQAAKPGAEVRYLDGSFPFINGFPLFPHLSHNDGKKLDLAFFYTRNNTPVNTKPSIIGYGVCEEPRGNELNMPLRCQQKGYWQYSILKTIARWSADETLSFDEDRTRQLITLLVRSTAIKKIFIEPHLKTRLHLTTTKIRFHGCQAVRHDDHIHIQLP